MGVIRFLALGAGQDVGRSCVIVTLGGRTVMFDCGMHMGYNDERRFPDFTLLSPSGEALDKIVDCVIITHFHLDHCGALPYLTEMYGYNGPIFMTHPTKALCPILLEDYRRITVERKGESNFFTLNMIKNCLDKVIPLKIHESYFLGGDNDFEIKPYYAGHVLGAAMFYVRVGTESVVYTGDYNMTPDRHLGAASIDFQLRPDILITESTYATTLRDSKRAREREFLRNIHQCVSAGGKVLIPVFALGRVQELCILIETYWERMGLTNVPVYFSAGMAETANEYYRIFVDWTNEHLQREFPMRNLFEFKFVKTFEKHFADQAGPMVLFSSPGMLHSGTSLEIFKRWCGDENNLLIIPGFCVSGTVGAKVLSGQKKIDLEEPDGSKKVLNVKMQVKNMSFSAHADARGIMQLIRSCKPRNVVLVHGEASKMSILKSQIITEMGINCFDPPNGQVLNLESSWDVPINIDPSMMEFPKTLIQRLAEDEDNEERLFELVKKRSSNQIETCGCIQWTQEEISTGRNPNLIHPSNFGRSERMTNVPVNLTISLKEPSKNLSNLFVNIKNAIFPLALVTLSDSQMIIQCNSIKLELIDPHSLKIDWSLIDTSLAKLIVDLIDIVDRPTTL